MANSLGKYLNNLRNEQSLSLREFAAKCNISHTHLDSIEKGIDPRTKKKVSISTDTLHLIADGLGLNFVFLACLADEYNPKIVTPAILPQLTKEQEKIIESITRPAGKNPLTEDDEGISEEGVEVGKAFDKARRKDKETVRLVLSDYMPRYAAPRLIAARGGMDIEAKQNTEQLPPLPEGDDIIP